MRLLSSMSSSSSSSSSGGAVQETQVESAGQEDKWSVTKVRLVCCVLTPSIDLVRGRMRRRSPFRQSSYPLQSRRSGGLQESVEAWMESSFLMLFFWAIAKQRVRCVSFLSSAIQVEVPIVTLCMNCCLPLFFT